MLPSKDREATGMKPLIKERQGDRMFVAGGKVSSLRACPVSFWTESFNHSGSQFLPMFSSGVSGGVL